MIPDSTLFQLEDRGYGFGTGHLCLPNRTFVAVAHSDDDTSNALLRAAWDEWKTYLKGNA